MPQVKRELFTQPDGIGITDLFPSISTSYAQDINNAGQVTGAYYLPTLPDKVNHPFMPLLPVQMAKVLLI